MALHRMHRRAGICARPPVGQQRAVERLFDQYLRTGIPNATVVKIAMNQNVTAPEYPTLVRDR
jgi:hypothetical protein